MKVFTSAYYSNSLGVVASALCMVHCAVTPFLFALHPVMENWAATHDHAHAHSHGSLFWESFDYLFLVLSLVAVWFSVRHSHNKALKGILWMAWGVLTFGLLIELQGIAWGQYIMYVGSAALIIAHIQNYRICRTWHQIPSQQFV